MKRYEGMTKEELLSVYKIEINDIDLDNIESLSKEDIMFHVKNEIPLFMHRHIYCDKIPFDECKQIAIGLWEDPLDEAPPFIDIEVKENEK